MKYIIEIEEKPLCVFDKDTQTYFPRLWRVKGFNSLVFDEDGLSRLEELNSDYINEHYGSLQDEAYKRGINDGSLDVKQRVEGAYQRGFDDGKDSVMLPCDGCKWDTEDGDGAHCKRCSRNCLDNYEEKQNDKIEVGDEVNWLGDCFIVTRIFQPHNMKGQCDGIDDDGCTYHDVLMDDLEKTGRHFDIASILDDMRHD